MGKDKREDEEREMEVAGEETETVHIESIEEQITFLSFDLQKLPSI